MLISRRKFLGSCLAATLGAITSAFEKSAHAFLQPFAFLKRKAVFNQLFVITTNNNSVSPISRLYALDLNTLAVKSSIDVQANLPAGDFVAGSFAGLDVAVKDSSNNVYIKTYNGVVSFSSSLAFRGYVAISTSMQNICEGGGYVWVATTSNLYRVPLSNPTTFATMTGLGSIGGPRILQYIDKYGTIFVGGSNTNGADSFRYYSISGTTCTLLTTVSTVQGSGGAGDFSNANNRLYYFQQYGGYDGPAYVGSVTAGSCSNAGTTGINGSEYQYPGVHWYENGGYGYSFAYNNTSQYRMNGVAANLQNFTLSTLWTGCLGDNTDACLDPDTGVAYMAVKNSSATNATGGDILAFRYNGTSMVKVANTSAGWQSGTTCASYFARWPAKHRQSGTA